MSFCLCPPRMIINGLQLERVEQFRYLGSLISANTSCEKDILSRIGFAQASFQRLFTGLFSREGISINTKMRVYLALIRTVLLYGCESWNITAALACTLDSCEMTFLRRILGVSKFFHLPNTAVRGLCHIKDSISLVTKRCRLTWLGHVLRMNSDRIPQKNFCSSVLTLAASTRSTLSNVG